MSSLDGTSLFEPTASAHTRRVLVIDDSVLVREAAKIALGATGGWEVLTATCGEEGIALAASEHPDAILLDVVMPGIDGITVAKHLQRMPSTSSLPVVLLTATGQPEDREGYSELGLAGVIAKPFDVAGLANQLATLLGWET
ncbi:MAG TPA: response regulator [Solirubrobacteraceae bacterium]|jgi:CheY-like chemotaxis protein